MTHILVVDDEIEIRNMLADILKDFGHEVTLCARGEEAIALNESHRFDLVLLDVYLQGSKNDGIDVLKRVKSIHNDIPVILISGHGNIEVAVSAIRQGAYDFIEKPFNINQLQVIITRALEASHLRQENLDLREKERSQARLIGESAVMTQLRDQLGKASQSNSRILFTGGYGAGKQTAARYLHQHSSRSNAPFVFVNSKTTSLDRNGDIVFTRFDCDQQHWLKMLDCARGGCIFLHEITELPMDVQKTMLQYISKKFSHKNFASIDPRILVATTFPIPEAVRQGTFLADLYSRLSIVSIDVPPLSRRREDMDLLVNYFIEQLHLEQGLPLHRLDKSVISAFQLSSWSKNISLLRNTVERIMLMFSTVDPRTISPDDLPSDITKCDGLGAENLFNEEFALCLMSMPLREARENFEKEYLIAQIHRFEGNISKTAEFIGMERSALHRKLRTLEVFGDIRQGK
jgi:two-component system nitrogen regulation response regulator NtrX